MFCHQKSSLRKSPDEVAGIKSTQLHDRNLVVDAIANKNGTSEKVFRDIFRYTLLVYVRGAAGCIYKTHFGKISAPIENCRKLW